MKKNTKFGAVSERRCQLEDLDLDGNETYVNRVLWRGFDAECLLLAGYFFYGNRS